MVVAFSYAGLPDGDGLAVSLLYGAGVFTIGAIGGLAWILSGERGLSIPASSRIDLQGAKRSQTE